MWKETNLGDVSIRITKGTTPSTLGGGFISSGVNFIKSEAVGHDGRIDKSTFVYIDEKTHEKLKRSQLQKDDILFSMAGIYLGKNAIVTEDILPANTNQALAIIRINQEFSLPQFVSYFLRQKKIIEHVNNMSGQSAQPNINFEEIKSIGIPLPPLSEQKRISETLSSLDDKIDLLHRQNKTLEALAETLFRQWFVEEAEESWEEIKLDDLIIVRYGKDHKTLSEGSIPVYGSGGIMRYADRALYDLESVLIPRKGSLNNIVYINEPFWTVDTMFYTEMRKLNIAKFIFHFLKMQDLGSLNVGSAVPSMTTEVLNNMTLRIPAGDVFEKYEEKVSELYIKIKSNINQIKTLTYLRDALLPKLMSGEVRIEN